MRFAARDPGSANVLAGILAGGAAQLPHDIWALPRAREVLERAGFAARVFEEPVGTPTLRDAWRDQPARLLISGTSHYEPFEPALWQVASEQGAVSLAVNDGWLNLAARFARGRPDFVGAIDPPQYHELVALGFAPERVLVTGHPWLATLMAERDALRATPEALLGSARGAAARVLFVSEPIAGDVARGVNAPFGFDELTAFALLERAAAGVAAAGRAVEIAVKLHPYEDAAAFRKTLGALPAVDGLRIELLEEPAAAHAWLAWSDLVVGIGSMLLLEAIVLGRPVVSLQPGLLREDTFIASRRGYADALVEPETALRRLAELIESDEARERERRRNAAFLDSLPADPPAAVVGWIRRQLPE